jgi:hypothetical protein
LAEAAVLPLKFCEPLEQFASVHTHEGGTSLVFSICGQGEEHEAEEGGCNVRIALVGIVTRQLMRGAAAKAAIRMLEA